MKTIVPRPIKERERKAKANGKVKTYTLSPEELERFNNLKQPTDQYGKPQKRPVMNTKMQGGGAKK